MDQVVWHLELGLEYQEISSWFEASGNCSHHTSTSCSGKWLQLCQYIHKMHTNTVKIVNIQRNILVLIYSILFIF